MDVDAGRGRLHRADDVRVCRPPQRRVNATLQADLGRTDGLGLGGSLPDLLQGQGIGVGVGPALGECAESAADVTDVGEVDVPVDHVGDVITDDVPAHVIGQRGDCLEIDPVAGEHRQVAVVAQAGGVILGADKCRPNIAI